MKKWIGNQVSPGPLLELLEYGGHPVICITLEQWSSTAICFTYKFDATRGSELVRQIQREFGRTSLFELVTSRRRFFKWRTWILSLFQRSNNIRNYVKRRWTSSSEESMLERTWARRSGCRSWWSHYSRSFESPHLDSLYSIPPFSHSDFKSMYTLV